MSIETLIQLWSREAIAHGYAGFIIIQRPLQDIDRIFLYDKEDAIGYTNVIKEVWL